MPKQDPAEVAQPEAERPLEPGDFVVHVGGHPQRGDSPSEPVGRVVAVVPRVKVVVEKDGKPKLDKDGSAIVEPDGELLAVTWPSLRIEGRYERDQLGRRPEPAKPKAV